MDKQLYLALKNKYESAIQEQKYNLKVWLDRPTIIPEHMNAVEEFDTAIQAIADFQERLTTLEDLYNETSTRTH